jgi:hypothetical protein
MAWLLRTPAFLLLLLVFFAVGPRHSLAEEQAQSHLDELVRYFDTVVFGSEIDKTLASHVIAKWDKPLSISIQGRSTPVFIQFIENHIKTLVKETGLKVLPLSDRSGKQHNFYIIFAKRKEMASLSIPGVPPALIRKLALPGGCFFALSKLPESRIIRSVIVVNAERDRMGINHCLLEEMAQSLGLPNDSNLMRPSIFSDRDMLVELSPNDRVLLKTLYHPKMAAGLPRAKALVVARGLIEEIVSRQLSGKRISKAALH